MDFLSVAFFYWIKNPSGFEEAGRKKNTNDEKKLVVIFTGKPEY